MFAHRRAHPDASSLGHALKICSASGWFLIRFSAIVVVLALSPSTYSRAYRATIANHIYTHTWQVLPWFTLVAALLSLVLIRIVVVTALSYGLSQYALQMVVRVLVLELIPLAAALFVTLRSGMVFTVAVPRGTPGADAGPLQRLGLKRLRLEVMPQVMAESFSVLSLAMVSSMVALVLAYLTVHGFSLWGLPGYTRTVGQVFNMSVTLGFLLKTVLFGLAVAVVPMAARLQRVGSDKVNHTLQPGAVPLFLVLLLIEASSLVVKYA